MDTLCSNPMNSRQAAPRDIVIDKLGYNVKVAVGSLHEGKWKLNHSLQQMMPKNEMSSARFLSVGWLMEVSSSGHTPLFHHDTVTGRPLICVQQIVINMFILHSVNSARCLMTKRDGVVGCCVTLTGTRTYRYGCDTYVVELVIGGRVTWRDHPEGGKRGENIHTLRKPKKTKRGTGVTQHGNTFQNVSHVTGGTSCGCWKLAAKALQRFAFKRIGISVTREQQQMPAYAHAPVHWENRNAWSWGCNYYSNI